VVFKVSYNFSMRTSRKIYLLLFGLILTGFFIPENFQMPVRGATASSYNKNSYWYYPWGKSGTHKGVDVFAKEGMPVVASTTGIVLYTGDIQLGGNVVLLLGPKWRLHYFAHLEKISTSSFSLLNAGEDLGTVGTTGNAKGKQPHLHYSIVTLIPYVWRIDSTHQGWKKMFYLNPIDFLN
jgi:murein DD-endopeptidase MepM/ murein hydrolase activator NlpD